MDPVTCLSADVPEIAAAYNRAVRRVPHCLPASDAAVATALFPESPNGPLRDQTVLAIRTGGRIAGFAHAVMDPPDPKKPNEPPKGVIPFLWYERGKRAVGQRLIDAACEHVRGAGATTIDAFPQHHRYPFYHLRAAYLSERLDHVQALFQFNGFERIGGEVFLDWVDLVPPPQEACPVDADISVEFVPGGGVLPGVHVRARRGADLVAECVNVSCGEYTDAPAAQDWTFTTWLGVEDAAQGKGMGLYMLRRALAEAHGVGYRHASISTAWDNHRAFVFYANHGYTLSDWTYGWRQSGQMATAP
ncbi:MAG: GNAT family N-acetyltransferase [bacterium]|nr:GNAT family N-acetyltransferase [bacterium]